jgi:hypothetical protein
VSPPTCQNREVADNRALWFVDAVSRTIDRRSRFMWVVYRRGCGPLTKLEQTAGRIASRYLALVRTVRERLTMVAQREPQSDLVGDNGCRIGLSWCFKPSFEQAAEPFVASFSQGGSFRESFLETRSGSSCAIVAQGAN